MKGIKILLSYIERVSILWSYVKMISILEISILEFYVE